MTGPTPLLVLDVVGRTPRLLDHMPHLKSRGPARPPAPRAPRRPPGWARPRRGSDQRRVGEQGVQVGQQLVVAGAGERRERTFLSLQRRLQSRLLQPRRDRTEHQFLRLRRDEVPQVVEGDLRVAGVGELLSQPLQLVTERIRGGTVQHRAHHGGDAAQAAAGDPQLVDGVGPFRADHDVGLLEGGDLGPEGGDHHLPRHLPAQPWLADVDCGRLPLRVDRVELLGNPGGRYEAVAEWTLAGPALPAGTVQPGLF